MQNDKSKFKKDFIKRLIRFSVDVLCFAKELKKHSELWPASDQLIRSATSVGANVVEAKSASSKRDYLKFFEIALKSANETIYWLIVIKEYEPKLNKKTEDLLIEIKQIANILGSSVITLKGKR